MSSFCTQCGRPLKEGEVCSCTSAGQEQQGQYYDQSQQAQYYDQGQQSQYYDQSQQGQYYGQQGQYYDQGQQGQYYGQQGQYYDQNQYGGQQGKSKEAEWISEKMGQFVSRSKSMNAHIKPILKAPVTKVQELAASNSPAVGVEFIVTKMAVSLVLALLFLFILDSKTHGYLEIPYFKFSIGVIAITLGFDALDAALMKLITGVFGGRRGFAPYINVVGATDVYTTFIIMISVVLFVIAPEVALIFLAITSSIVTYVKMSAYCGVADIPDDKKPYAYFVIRLCFTVVMTLIVYLFFRSLLNSVVGSVFGDLGSFL